MPSYCGITTTLLPDMLLFCEPTKQPIESYSSGNTTFPLMSYIPHLLFWNTGMHLPNKMYALSIPFELYLLSSIPIVSYSKYITILPLWFITPYFSLFETK